MINHKINTTVVDVVVVDEFPIIRHGLSELINGEPDMRVVATVSCARKALAMVRLHRPTIIILEWDLVGSNAVQFCTAIKAMPWTPRVLVYTANATSEAVVAAIHAGVDSYIHKSSDLPTVVDSIKRTCANLRVWLPRRFSPSPPTRPRGITTPTQNAMTDREKQVLALLVQRYNNQEIADELHLAYQTVKNYVSKILAKLGATNRHELSAKKSIVTARAA